MSERSDDESSSDPSSGQSESFDAESVSFDTNSGRNSASASAKTTKRTPEERCMSIWKFLVLLLMVLVGAAVTTMSYITLDAASSKSYDENHRNAVLFTSIVAVLFLLLLVVFLLYDIWVKRQTKKLAKDAKRSNAILSSLFPANVRDRLLEDAAGKNRPSASKHGGVSSDENMPTKNRLKNYLEDGELAEGYGKSKGNSNVDDDEEVLGYDSAPIADLFPEATVMFADIAGFTAWSSVREPAQVFTLLETLYRAFDNIATQRRVFKVETSTSTSLQDLAKQLNHLILTHCFPFVSW